MTEEVVVMVVALGTAVAQVVVVQVVAVVLAVAVAEVVVATKTRGEITAGNSTYPKGGVSCSKDSFVVNQTLVFQIKFCGKSPALRVAANRYTQGVLTYSFKTNNETKYFRQVEKFNIIHLKQAS